VLTRQSDSIGGDTARPAAAGASGSVTVDDANVHERLMKPWDLIISPADAAPYGCTVQYVTTPLFSFYRESYRCSARIVGRSPPDMLVFMVPIRTADGSTYWKRPVPGTGISMTPPAGVEARFERGQTHFMTLVDLALVRSGMSGELVRECERRASVNLLPASSQVVASYGAWMQDVLDEAAQDRSMMQSPAVVQCLSEQLLHHLSLPLQALADCGRRPPLSARRKIIERALDHVHAKPESSLTVPELAAAARVSRRTLEYAFQDTFDMTPLSYLRLHRLHVARQRLMVTDGKQGTVTRVAHDLGFWHLARFASTYRAQFGECPSQTLARRKPQTPGLLLHGR